MATVYEPARPGATAANVLVLLPGFGDSPSAFQEARFVESVHKKAPTFDVVLADAHFGYYRKFDLVERLRADVIVPLKARGYRELWLGGISMGGFGALAFTMEHPDLVDGTLVLAPYLGPTDLIESIQEQGGLERWQPQSYAAEDDEERYYVRLWTWLKSLPGKREGPPVFLAWGENDRLRFANREMARVLPRSHVRTRAGDHDWETWHALFEGFFVKLLAER